MTGPVQIQVWTIEDWISSLANRGRMMQYHLSLPSGYIQSMLPTKEELSGVKPLSLDLSQKVQLIGVE